MYDGDEFEYEGRMFRVSFEHDGDHEAPWECCDGHGPVSDWRPLDSKRAGELVLATDRRMARFYDFQAAVKLARKDGWGAKGDEGMAPGAKAEHAARADFERLRSWCNDRWNYMCVTVNLLDDDGNDTGDWQSIGGVESDGGDDYLRGMAHDMAGEILATAKPQPIKVSAEAFETVLEGLNAITDNADQWTAEHVRSHAQHLAATLSGGRRKATA